MQFKFKELSRKGKLVVLFILTSIAAAIIIIGLGVGLAQASNCKCSSDVLTEFFYMSTKIS